MSTFVITPTPGGYAVEVDDYKVIARSPRNVQGSIKVTLRISRGGAVVTTDTANLTSSRSRKNLLGNLHAKNVELDEGVLIALEEACREWLDGERGPPDEARNTATNTDAATSVLAVSDPLELVKAAMRTSGYGGDLRAPLIAYLAGTSRLLAMRPGTMPVHLLLLGPASAGKSYSLRTALALMPPEAFHTIDAGSPRVLIYDAADLRHRIVVFSEADSLPAGEDNPAASAIRNLLQDHSLHYKVTVRDPDTNSFVVREIVREGPSVLITTSTKSLGNQLSTRLFTLDVPDDASQVGAALLMQAGLEEGERQEGSSDALIAYQAVLQSQAPWDVKVPFAKALATEIGRSAKAPRILRDFQRLLSLVKAVAVLRHQHRQHGEDGRLIAQRDDYATVYDLVAEMYEGTVTGATEKVRKVVEAVGALCTAGSKSVTYTAIAEALALRRDAAWRAARTAIRHGWLINLSADRARASLVLGEPLPERSGLPTTDQVCCSVAAITGESTTTTPRGETEEDLACCIACAALIQVGDELCANCHAAATTSTVDAAGVTDSTTRRSGPILTEDLAGSDLGGLAAVLPVGAHTQKLLDFSFTNGARLINEPLAYPSVTPATLQQTTGVPEAAPSESGL